MPSSIKFLLGLAAVILLGWVYHGPLGNGERFLRSIEGQAQSVVAQAEVPAVSVRLDRDPLTRSATLSGPADQFQRYGRGSFQGVTQRVAEVPGIAAVRWADEPGEGGFVLPLLGESLIPMVAAYLMGLLIGWRLWSPRQHY